MIGIYKYTNKLNKKIYIGRSTNIAKRKWEHKNSPSRYSYFDQTLKSLGEDQFIFEIIEECNPSELKEREKYWINYYQCCVLDNRNNGYNLTHGGEEYCSDENRWAKLTVSQIEEIIQKLENSKMSIKEISEQYQVHYNTISNINRCKTWNWLHSYKNNIRKESQGSNNQGELGTNKISESQAIHIIDLLKNSNKPMSQIAKKENISLNIIYDINRCKTWTFLHKYKHNIRQESQKEGGLINED